LEIFKIIYTAYFREIHWKYNSNLIHRQGAVKLKNNPKTLFNIKLFLFFIVNSIFLIFLDQLTKKFAALYLKNQKPLVIFENVFELHYLENRGAAFGIMQGGISFFVPLTIFMCACFIFLYFKLPQNKKFNAFRIVLCFFFAGAIGNFIDRVTYGYVIDFFYFKLINFPIFNVADIYITCGAFVFAFLLLFYYKEEDMNEIKLFKKKG